MNKNRLEAFTDAIIAIAATIMVLDLDIPKRPTLPSLLADWPILLAYIISFTLIYTVWLSHHNLFEKAKVISVKTYLINGFWLFSLTLVPFATNWMGSNTDQTWPEVIYDTILLLWSFAFELMDRQIIRDNPGTKKDQSTEFGYRVTLYGTYCIGIVLAFVRPIYNVFFIALMTAALTIRMIKKNVKSIA